jgi:hypothetical protein
MKVNYKKLLPLAVLGLTFAGLTRFSTQDRRSPTCTILLAKFLKPRLFSNPVIKNPHLR